jgi:ABC-type transport system involved in multi-copper enzyme maturation permease subunit
MLRTIIEKELKAILLSPKFAVTFGACSLLIILSVLIGIQEYRAAVRQHETATQLAEQQLREASSWMGINNRVYRQPDPMQIFVSGVNNDIGRFSIVSNFEGIKLRNSIYSDDPIFAVFRFIDLTFIFQVVLSLFAILFTYDAINGERENGTLQLSFANAIPRAQYLLGKFLGALLGLVVPLLIPILIGILLVLVFQISFTATHWAKLATVLGISLLFFTCFVAIGLFISTLTKRSSVSFLIALVTWVLLVLIVPRAAVMAAGQMVRVPAVAEIESQRDAYERDQWQKLTQGLQERWRKRSAGMEGMTVSEREAHRDEHEWDWMQEDDAHRKAAQKDIEQYALKLREELRNRKIQQEKLAFALSRFSPASAYQLATINLAGTDIAVKTRYEDAMQIYRTAFTEAVEKKREASGGQDGIRIEFNSDTGMKFSLGRAGGSLDVSDLPRFTAPEMSFAEALAPAVIDFGLLAVYAILAFVGAFVAFLRYDVRWGR